MMNEETTPPKPMTAKVVNQANTARLILKCFGIVERNVVAMERISSTTLFDNDNLYGSINRKISITELIQRAAEESQKQVLRLKDTA